MRRLCISLRSVHRLMQFSCKTCSNRYNACPGSPLHKISWLPFIFRQRVRQHHREIWLLESCARNLYSPRSSRDDEMTVHHPIKVKRIRDRWVVSLKATDRHPTLTGEQRRDLNQRVSGQRTLFDSTIGSDNFICPVVLEDELDFDIITVPFHLDAA